jgi:photosystem II stability/assembly factor-like uncharacterized protein
MLRRNVLPAAALIAVLAAANAPFLESQAVAPETSGDLFKDMDWRLIGPFRGGRAVAVAGIPGDGTTFFFGAVDGGVWKTTNAGTTWKPVFDGQRVASIGALAVAPSDPKVMYAGTGESDIRSDLASGNGVYRSGDGGETWQAVGLASGLGETRQIAKIVVDPSDAETVYVGALGHAYGPNPERGVYKSTDGGKTWKQVLYKGPELGVADLAIAAANPKVLFASLWNAHRPPWSTYAPIVGEGSGLYRSEDGGATWLQCTGHGLPEGKWGRSGVAVSPDGRRVYALVEAGRSGLYVSSDGGVTWSLANADARLTSRAWYFSRITVDPTDPETIYMPNIALMGSNDGGKTVHVVRGAPGGDDYHELWVDPQDGKRLLLGTDQGTSISLDRGLTWSTWYNQPTAQLYHVTTDDRFPYTVYGSQQDSGGAAVVSRTDHGQITPRDWFPASGSESGQMAIDPKDNDILYVSGGYGTVSRWDRRTSLAQDITPWPVPVFGTEIDRRRYRDPWTPPLVFSPADKTSLYLGTQYVMKTTDGGLHWKEISPDLTGGKAVVKTSAVAAAGNPSAGNSIGRGAAPTPETAIGLGYGTLASVAPSYLDPKVIWAGSDTGIVSVTRDGGATWATVTPPGMTAWSRVSGIEPGHFDPGVAYAAVERHRADDQRPYIYRTKDFGKTWEAITTGLAAPAFVNAIREDPKRTGLRSVLYAGTEFGVYVSFNDGDNWQPLQLNLPVTSVRDLTVHGDDLIVATHGRGFWVLDDIAPLREIADGGGTSAPLRHGLPYLYEPEVAMRIDSDGFAGTPLPPEEPTAENPPSGAILDYYLPGEAKTLELNIYTAEHTLVRHISSAMPAKAEHMELPIADRWFPVPQRLETTPGQHRFVWNLAWGTSGVAESDEPDDGEGGVPRGPKVVPGSYTVEFVWNGKPLYTQPLTVVMDPRAGATTAQLKENFGTTYGIFTASLEARRALAEMESVAGQLKKSVPADPVLAGQARSVLAKIEAITSGSGSGSGSVGLEQANTELTSALNVAESSDRGIPAQALEIFAEASGASAGRVKDWAGVKSGSLAEYNRGLEAAKLPPIAVSAIEREVFVLMTQ